MKNWYNTLLIVFLAFLVTSCGTSYSSSSSGAAVKGKNAKVLKEANTYLGTRYKYGGTNKRGMDCSGLVYVAFQKVGVQPPRISYKQAEFGKKIRLNQVEPGDLLFFNTSGSRISHVGIVDHIKRGEIFFIHSSSSQGVTITSLENPYWKKRFVKARRYL